MKIGDRVEYESRFFPGLMCQGIVWSIVRNNERITSVLVTPFGGHGVVAKQEHELRVINVT